MNHLGLSEVLNQFLNSLKKLKILKMIILVKIKLVIKWWRKILLAGSNLVLFPYFQLATFFLNNQTIKRIQIKFRFLVKNWKFTKNVNINRDDVQCMSIFNLKKKKNLIFLIYFKSKYIRNKTNFSFSFFLILCVDYIRNYRQNENRSQFNYLKFNHWSF